LFSTAQIEWGNLARPLALLDVHPLLNQYPPTRSQPSYFPTRNAGLTQYECGVFETVIGRYLAVETREGLNKLIRMIYITLLDNLIHAQQEESMNFKKIKALIKIQTSTKSQHQQNIGV